MLLQYYNFLRLGREGYRSVQRACHDVARHLADEIVKLAPFELWGDDIDIPVFAWRLKHGYTDKWDLYDLGNQLRQRGWLVPAYPMPDDLADLTVQRVVVRNGLSMDLADSLLDHITDSVRSLDGRTDRCRTRTADDAFHRWRPLPRESGPVSQADAVGGGKRTQPPTGRLEDRRGDRRSHGYHRGLARASWRQVGAEQDDRSAGRRPAAAPGRPRTPRW